MKSVVYTVFVCLCLHSSIFAQSGEDFCGEDYLLKKNIERNPDYLKEYQQKLQQLNDAVEKFKSQKIINPGAAQIIEIPIVFHVVYNTDEENISDEQIYSQIEILNNDYRRTNSDKNNTPIAFHEEACDTRIQFCLAKIDPNGKSTNGIVRVSTNEEDFIPGEEKMKQINTGSASWDVNKYLNIWICDIKESEKILGYALTMSTPLSPNDGVVVDYRCVGNIGDLYNNYNKGRVCTHEIGHYLGLVHIWGGSNPTCADDDFIDDTPKQYDKIFGNPSFPFFSCSPSGIDCCNVGPEGNMFMNYMDYTADIAKNMFTNGQRDRMLAVLNTARLALATSDKCNSPMANCYNYNVSNIRTTAQNNGLDIAIAGIPSNTDIYKIRYRAANHVNWIYIDEVSMPYNLNGLLSGTCYEFQVAAICQREPYIQSNFSPTITACTKCGDNYEPNNTCTDPYVLNINGSKMTVSGMIAEDGDMDFYQFKVYPNANNVKIQLSLPIGSPDYDLILRSKENEVIATSYNASNSAEIILANNLNSGDYIIEIVGANGNFSNSLCYTLIIETGPFRFTIFN